MKMRETREARPNYLEEKGAGNGKRDEERDQRTGRKGRIELWGTVEG